MKNIKALTFILIFVLVLSGCSKRSSHYERDEVAMGEMSAQTIEGDDYQGSQADSEHGIKSLASVATIEVDTTDFKLITTVGVKFKTQSVDRTIPEVEKILQANGGVILRSTIESDKITEKIVKETIDSTYFKQERNMEGSITVYVPKQNVYRTLEQISGFATQIDSRTVCSQDVSIELLRASLNKKRGAKRQQRVENIDENKTKKLQDALDVDQTLEGIQKQQDEISIQQFELNRKLKYTLLTIAIYQDPYSHISSLAKEKTVTIDFKDRFVDSLAFGWLLFSSFLLFFISIWPITIALIIIALFYFKRLRKKKREDLLD